ncbi:YqkE family protein [Pontibacillus salicampi]|uniref:YqkE family protein n=1 Tax=Pontibacillus salicampi TaxID=1449801 RepID=A0ABV6LL66_9BACI
MSKKRKAEDQAGTLQGMLDEDMLQRLRSKKSDLKQQEQAKQEEEQRRKAEERKRREANKSFEELLNESNMDNWKNFKD